MPKRITLTPKRKTIGPAMRKRVLDRDGHKCVKCGDTEGPFQLDHIIAVEKFGPHTDANLETLCHGCHRPKTNRDRQDIRKQKRLEKARRALLNGIEKPKRKSKIGNRGWNTQYRRKMNGKTERIEE